MAKVLVTGGSGYIAGFWIARLLGEGFAVRATVRDVGRAEAVRAALGTLCDASAVEVVGADLTRDAGWAEAAAGATPCCMWPRRSRAGGRNPMTTWWSRRGTGRCGCCGRPATRGCGGW